MATLAEYQQATRDLLRDDNNKFYSPTQLARWINRARRQVAKMGQCVRLLPPSTASVTTITVTQGGSGFTSAPTVTVGDPDGAATVNSTATASASVSGGVVTSITVITGGAGYVAVPDVTISGGGGTGATATAVLGSHIATVVNQEVYRFEDISAIIALLYPGAGEVLGIQSVAVSQGAMKPMLSYLPFSQFQAYLRAYPYMRTWPTVWSQYGQGALGNYYVYPIPAQVTQMDVDCYCSVQDLTSGQTVDLIPEPWFEAVNFWAAHLAFLYSQRPDDARNMIATYEGKMLEARGAVDVSRIPTFYGGNT